jgi:hypothetical protein
MTNPPHRFGADGRLDERVLHIRPCQSAWSTRSVRAAARLVEDFSLGVLGPPQLARSQPRRGVSMTAPAMEFSADEIAELVAVASQPGYRRWLEMVRSTGGCVDLMHLIGCSSLIDQASGETLGSYRTADKPNSELLVASQPAGLPLPVVCRDVLCRHLPRPSGRPGRR